MKNKPKSEDAAPHDLASLFQAAKDADWMQIVLNQGPPCFHLEDGRFCLRAQRWHDAIAENVCHKYFSLEDLLRKAIAEHAELARNISQAEREKAKAYDTLRDLVGDTRQGSDATVTIYQDDATHDYFVKVTPNPKVSDSEFGQSLLTAVKKWQD